MAYLDNLVTSAVWWCIGKKHPEMCFMILKVANGLTHFEACYSLWTKERSHLKHYISVSNLPVGSGNGIRLGVFIAAHLAALGTRE